MASVLRTGETKNCRRHNQEPFILNHEPRTAGNPLNTKRAGNILLLCDRMGDYHRARWDALKEKAEGTVIAADLYESDDLYGWKTTEGVGFTCLGRSGLTVFWLPMRRFLALLKEHSISTVCIPGYGNACYLAMLILSKLRGHRVILFAESWYPGNAVKDLVKSLFLRCFVDRFLLSGQRARNHFEKRLSVAPDRIRTGYSVVDNAYFAIEENQVGRVIPNAPQTETPTRTLLCVARFAPEKNLEQLIDCFESSDLTKRGWQLKLIGGGPLREKLEGMRMDRPWLVLVDWMSYEALPAAYAAADCFVLPSRFEPWGLVVNEAMSAGLPVIVSDAVGAAPDLVSEENGWVFPAGDPEALVRSLNRLAEASNDTLEKMGTRSVEKMSAFTCRGWADQVLELALT